jgi:arsenate reductase-like glutaredoxin family protein
LLAKGAELEERNLGKDPLTVDELDALIGRRNYLEFLNPRNELYRKLKMKENPPSRAQALKWMSKEPNLIRRPIVVRGGEMILGFDEEGLGKMAQT